MAIPFSRRSARHRDWTQVSSIVGRFFAIWATREAFVQHTHAYLLGVCSWLALLGHPACCSRLCQTVFQSNLANFTPTRSVWGPWHLVIFHLFHLGYSGGKAQFNFHFLDDTRGWVHFFFLVFSFWSEPFYSLFLNLLQYCLFLFFWPWSMWDLSPLTRDPAQVPSLGDEVLTAEP